MHQPAGGHFDTRSVTSCVYFQCPPHISLYIQVLVIVILFFLFLARLGFPGGSVVKNPPANAGGVGYAGSIPGLGRSLGGGNGNPLQYSCLRNPMDRRAWQATVHGLSKTWTQHKPLSPIAEDPSAPPSYSSWLFDASPCVPAVVLYYCTFQGTVLKD